MELWKKWKTNIAYCNRYRKKNTVVKTDVKENKEWIRLKEAEKCRSVWWKKRYCFGSRWKGINEKPPKVWMEFLKSD